MKTKPLQHQLEYFNQFGDDEVAAIFTPMGSGKTKMVIDTAFNLYERGMINAVVYTTMKITVGRFHNELAKHGWDNGYRLGIMTGGMNAAQKKEFERMRKHSGFKFLALNHEQMVLKKSKEQLKEFLKQNNVLWVMDESHKIKTPNRKRSKAAIDLSKYAKARRIMTGTSLTKNLLDLYTQFAFLDKEIIGFKNYTAFKHRYAVIVKKKAALGHYYDDVVGFRNEQELIDKIRPFVFYRRKDQCMDLPPKVYKIVEDEMTAEQKKLYKELITEKVAMAQEPPPELETPEEILLWAVENNVLIDGVNPLTRLIRLQQILHGKANDFELKTNRYNTLLDVLESIGDEQVVIWANFRYEVEKIAETLGDNAVIHYGGMSDTAKAESIDRFASGDVQYFVANPSSAGTGLDELSVANYEVYFSNSHSFTNREQSEDRCHRIGTTKSVIITDIVAKGTIDELILERLEEKRGAFNDFYARLQDDQTTLVNEALNDANLFVQAFLNG